MPCLTVVLEFDHELAFDHGLEFDLNSHLIMGGHSCKRSED